MDWLHINDLRLRCIVGVHLHERKSEQDLHLDIALAFDFTEAAASDNLEDTLDYTTLTSKLTDWARREKFQLIETLAVRACDLIRAEWPKVRRCRVTVKKPTALPLARHASATAERGDEP
jgi:7,8-dihydroneopterin aldolase/epimerase/oxygenase